MSPTGAISGEGLGLGQTQSMSMGLGGGIPTSGFNFNQFGMFGDPNPSALNQLDLNRAGFESSASQSTNEPCLPTLPAPQLIALLEPPSGVTAGVQQLPVTSQPFMTMGFGGGLPTSGFEFDQFGMFGDPNPSARNQLNLNGITAMVGSESSASQSMNEHDYSSPPTLPVQLVASPSLLPEPLSDITTSVQQLPVLPPTKPGATDLQLNRLFTSADDNDAATSVVGRSKRKQVPSLRAQRDNAIGRENHAPLPALDVTVNVKSRGRKKVNPCNLDSGMSAKKGLNLDVTADAPKSKVLQDALTRTEKYAIGKLSSSSEGLAIQAVTYKRGAVVLRPDGEYREVAVRSLQYKWRITSAERWWCRGGTLQAAACECGARHDSRRRTAIWKSGRSGEELAIQAAACKRGARQLDPTVDEELRFGNREAAARSLQYKWRLTSAERWWCRGYVLQDHFTWEVVLQVLLQ
ncbi:hypothetical protein EV363DRAFT_1159615 [Boletus edulis]|nr:hypothetical protein EV363DRAFT_1159615 [Boletus edulis]